MLEVVGDNDHVGLASCYTNHQVEVLNDLTDAFQTKFFAAKGFRDLVDTNYCVIVYQHLCLTNLLFAIAFRSIIGSIEQLHSGDGRDAAQRVVLNALLAHALIAT